MAKVEKLTIESFKTIDCSGTPLKGIYLQVNPEKISLDYGMSLRSAKQ